MPIEELYRLYQQCTAVVIDSRKIIEGCLFFALRGTNFDGNRFSDEALSKGAAYAVIDNADYHRDAGRTILVKDVLSTLQSMARYHRDQFNIPLIAITGTNGKTTTKELINAVLKDQYRTHTTFGNFNNHIGVPLTILAMPENTEIAVVEMGANHLGEIGKLCQIANPNYGLITNIGKAHLEGFGSLEGIRKAKAELYEYLAEKNGFIFKNKDESLPELPPGARTINYGRSNTLSLDEKDYQVILLDSTPFVKVSFLSRNDDVLEAQSQLVGTYNFGNIMTAIAIGKYFKVPAAKIKEAIEKYVPQNNRSQILKRGSNTFILDAYNANPSSMRSALSYFSTVESNNKVAILGDMLELGKNSPAEHSSIVKFAKKCSLKKLLLVGREFEPIAKAENLSHFSDVAALKTWFDQQDWHQTHFLVKGSRGIHLETLLT